MRVTIVSCIYLLYEYLLKLQKNCPRPRGFVLGLVLVLGVLSSSSASSSGVWPRSTSLLAVALNETYYTVWGNFDHKARKQDVYTGTLKTRIISHHIVY